MPALCEGDLEFPVKVGDIPKFEKPKNLETNVSELNNTVFFTRPYQ